MSVRITSLVWDSDVQPASVRYTLMALADNANDGGMCRPGVAYLSGKSGFSRAAVFKALEQLESEGLIQRRARVRANGSRTSSAFRIVTEVLRTRARPVTVEEDRELAEMFETDDAIDLATAERPAESSDETTPVSAVDGGRPVAGPPGPSLEPTTSSSDADATDKPKASKASKVDDEPTRTDVETLCRRMLDRLQANEVKASITKTWRTEARRLLDIDKRDLQTALGLIDWATSDPFWRSNILSIPKFREKYDQLLMKARTDPRWKAESGDDGDGGIDVDAILGKDLWRPEAPADIEFGDPAARAAWYRDAADTRKAERLEMAKARLGARRRNA